MMVMAVVVVVVKEMDGEKKRKGDFSEPWLCVRNTKSKTGKQQSARNIAQVILLQNQLWFLDRAQLCCPAALVAPECHWSPCFSLLSIWDYSPVALCWAKTSSLTISLKLEETLDIPQDTTLHRLVGNSKLFSPSFLLWPTRPQMLSSGYHMDQLLWNSSFRWLATNGSPGNVQSMDMIPAWTTKATHVCDSAHLYPSISSFPHLVFSHSALTCFKCEMWILSSCSWPMWHWSDATKTPSDFLQRA